MYPHYGKVSWDFSCVPALKVIQTNILIVDVPKTLLSKSDFQYKRHLEKYFEINCDWAYNMFYFIAHSGWRLGKLLLSS